MLGNDPMSMTGLLFLGLHILSGLAFERISDKKPGDELELEGWMDGSGALSKSVRLVIAFFPLTFSLPHGQQPMSLTKHGLWRRDPQELHFSASASCK